MRRIHPGEVLREDYMLALEMTPQQLAQRLDVDEAGLRQFLLERSPLTVQLANQITKAFGGSEKFWFNLQNKFDKAVQHG